MGRKDVLSTGFVLAALLAQTYELEQAGRGAPLVAPPRDAALHRARAAREDRRAPLRGAARLHRVFHPYLAGRRAPGAPLDWGRVLPDAAVLLPHAVVTAGIVLWYQGVLSQFGVIGRLGPGRSAPSTSRTWRFRAARVRRVPALPRLAAGALRLLPLAGCRDPAHDGRAARVARHRARARGGLAYCCLRRRDLAFYALGFRALLVPTWASSSSTSGAPTDTSTWLRSPWSRSPRCCSRSSASAAVARRFAVAASRSCSPPAARSRRSASRRCGATTSRCGGTRPLSEPSLLSIQALAKEYADQAERESDPARRQALSSRRAREVLRGIERERALGRRPSRLQDLRDAPPRAPPRPARPARPHRRRAAREPDRALRGELPHRAASRERLRARQAVPRAGRCGARGRARAAGARLLRALRPIPGADVARPGLARAQRGVPGQRLRAPLPVPRQRGRRSAPDVPAMSAANPYVGAYPELPGRRAVWGASRASSSAMRPTSARSSSCGPGYCDFLNQFPGEAEARLRPEPRDAALRGRRRRASDRERARAAAASRRRASTCCSRATSSSTSTPRSSTSCCRRSAARSRRAVA